MLGIYVGTAFDGLSGGGGAVSLFLQRQNKKDWIFQHFFFFTFQIKNGEFIGNFLGTVVASLSAVLILF